MKVLILATELSPNPGGIQRYTHSMAVAAGKTVGASNVLVLPFNGGYPGAPAEYGLDDTVARLKRMFIVFRRGWQQTLHTRRLIKKFRPDLIICNHVELAPHGQWANEKWGTPYWVIAYGIEVWGKIPPKQSVALGKATRIVSISKVTEDILVRKGFDQKKMELVFYGFDTNLFSPGADTAITSPILLTVCRLDASERYKGYDRVVELMPDLLKEFPSLRYRIVGDGSDRERVEEIMRKNGVTDQVEITGLIRDVNKIVGYYRQSSLFVMPSEFRAGDNPIGEGFGFVYLEAAACGKPVIAAKGGGAAESVADGETGILIDPTDRSALYNAIARFLRSPEEARRFGAAGRERTVRLFSVENFNRRVGELLKGQAS